MSDVDSLRVELGHALDGTEKWLLAGVELGLDNDPTEDSDADEALRTIRRLRTRAASSMINIALLGGFSSGKSFLVGGLQGRLEYAPVTDEDGMKFDQYIGVLPSASKATTACPATVVPVDDGTGVDGSGRGFFRVRFTDGNTWEDLGNSPVPSVVAAYSTQDPRAIARGRKPVDRDRTVAEVEVLLSNPRLPAKLYDLPGHGSPHPVHDEIANSAWADADCFIYTIQATHTLSRLDLDLINRLHAHHVNSGKQVIWVMTGIDRAAMANYDGRAEWRDALEANNAYLRENFPPTTGTADTFVGPDGFLPVSPAWEAVGNWKVSQGESASGEKYISMSRMRQLRSRIIDLVDAGAGRKHIRTVALEARTIVLPKYRALAEILESARLPLEELSAERTDLGERLVSLRSASETVRLQLEGALRAHMRTVEKTFRGLPAYLHAELDDQIGTADLIREKEANRIEVRKTQTLNKWAMERGPVRVLDAELAQFAEGVLHSVRAALRDAAFTDGVDGELKGVDLAQLIVPPSRRYRTASSDLVQRVSGVVGLSTPVAGAIAAGAGLVSGPFLAVPAGVTLVAGLIYAGIRRKSTRTTALDVLRREWVDELDVSAQFYEQAFLAAAKLRGNEIIDRAVELLSERSDELSRKIILVESRLADPVNADRSELVGRLEPHCRTGKELLSELSQLTL